MKLNKSVWFCAIVTIYVLATCCSCRSVKNLTKKIDTVLTQHDSSSISVQKDSSKFNSEVVIEYDDTTAMNKLMDGANINWQPFVIEGYDPNSSPYGLVSNISKNRPIKRIVIRSNVELHKIDSSSIHEISKQTEKKTEKVLAKKTVVHFPWWILIFIGVVLFLLYEKYKVKIKALWSSISAIR